MNEEQERSTELTEGELHQLMQQQMVREAVSERDMNQQEQEKGELINVQQVVRDIERSLLGTEVHQVQVSDGAGGTWTREIELQPWQEIDYERGVIVENQEKKDQQICNPRCVLDIKRTIRAHLNRNVSGSYLEPKDIFHSGAAACQAIGNKLYVYQEEYNIDGPADADQIMSIVRSNLKAAIRKAYHGRLLKHSESTRSIRVLEKSEEGEESRDKRGGWLSKVI